uniref:Ig-like domain-containing protein n=1 Tax=Pelusios castaneus TaxID=367368 RepID=A0A8C8VLK8_9SAUR
MDSLRTCSMIFPGIEVRLTGLSLAWFLALLGGVTAEPDTTPEAGNSPHLYHQAGQDVTLECKVQAPQETHLRQLHVYWHFLQEPAGISVVHSYSQGADQLGDQAEEFRGRTRLSLQGLNQGVVALILSDVRPSDSGTYRCFLMDNQGADTMDIVLQVAAPYELPQLIILSQDEGQVSLQCHTTGGYPKPEILWHDANGTQLSQEEPVELQRSSRGTFDVWSNLSLTYWAGMSVCCTLNHAPLQQNMSVCVILPALVTQPQAEETGFPVWVIPALTLVLVTIVCMGLIHWALPLIPMEGIEVRCPLTEESQGWSPVRVDPPEEEMAEH